MPSYKKFSQSKFFKKDDVTPPVIDIVELVELQNVAKEGEPKKMRLVASFKTNDKALVLNTTNCEVLAEISGTDDTDNWPGTEVELFNDPEVRYAGKKTGGVRLRQANGHRPF